MKTDTIKLPAGFGLRAFESVGSTNDIARELAGDPAVGNMVVCATEQVTGRGRSGRSWHSPKGNLYTTVLVKNLENLSNAATLSLVAAVAMGEAVAACLPDASGLGYKWPNDLLWNRAKFCGLLLECGTNPAGDSWVMIGSGVNFSTHPKDTPYPATNLLALGCKQSVEVLLERYIERLAHWLQVWREQGVRPVRDAWLTRAVGLGELITARLANGEVKKGWFRDLDATGALILDVPNQGIHVVTAGDVFFD